MNKILPIGCFTLIGLIIAGMLAAAIYAAINTPSEGTVIDHRYQDEYETESCYRDSNNREHCTETEYPEQYTILIENTDEEKRGWVTIDPISWQKSCKRGTWYPDCLIHNQD